MLVCISLHLVTCYLEPKNKYYPGTAYVLLIKNSLQCIPKEQIAELASFTECFYATIGQILHTDVSLLREFEEAGSFDNLISVISLFPQKIMKRVFSRTTSLNRLVLLWQS